MSRRISGDIIPKRKAELIESLHKKRVVEDSYVEDFKPATNRKKSGIAWKVSLLLVLILVISFGLWQETYLFSYAKIRIVPKGQNLDLDFTVVASKDLRNGQISLKTVKLSAEQSTPVTATVKKQISEKATGEVVMYNTFDTKSQELVARTRLETPEGKVFRLLKDVVVPGYKIVAGKKVPGNTVVTVVASLPGKEYNLGLKDFTLPAFKGTPRYSAIYARSKTPLSGGKIEDTIVPSDADLEKANSEIESKLKSSLSQSIKNQIPQGYTVFDDGIFYSYGDISTSNSGTTATKRGTVQAILINIDELTRYIAKKKLAEYKDEPVNLVGFNKLILTIPTKSGQNIDQLEKVEIRVKGNASIVYNFDTDSFRAALASLPKNQYATVLSRYPAIDTADISFTPNWTINFPSNSDRIQVEVVNSPLNKAGI